MLYQIYEKKEKLNHAGSKATDDVAQFALEAGFQELPLVKRTETESYLGKIQRQIGYYLDFKKLYRMIPKDAVVLIQNPFHDKQMTREKILDRLVKEKHIKFISLIHDIEELRKMRFNEYYRQEFEFMLQHSSVYIVHNRVMKTALVQKGIDESRIVELGIFDYFVPEKEKQKAAKFVRAINIAGNLDHKKSHYLAELSQYCKNTKINLYGNNFDHNVLKGDNIEYHGSFPSDDIPFQLKEGFGLVWDGDSADTCLGDTGNYLRYNNPHKLSLYIASGIPVIIWEEAAEAALVKESGVGFTISSIKEIDDILANMTEEEYLAYQKNVFDMGERLKTGFYTKSALEKCLKILEQDAK